MAGSIVEGWLRSLNLVHYTQAFLDNGYDDLEVCKQVGEADLDAIGVAKKDHREKLLRAVRILKEEGGTAVYFTLEDPVNADNSYEETAVFGDIGPAPESPPQGLFGEVYDAGRTALLTYPKVQLKHILRDTILEDEIDLSGPPYTAPDHSLCQSSLTALAVKYAKQFNTHFADVWDRLEELWKIAKETDNFRTICRSPMHSIYGGSLLYGFAPRGVPPPLPSCPPPSTSHVDRTVELPISPRSNGFENYVAIDGDVKDGLHNDGKKSSLGKFFRNIGIRRSGRKNSYKQHTGDPLASDITMSDEDRIALMVMVKEGKISTETALEVVKRFEDDRKLEEIKENRQGDFSLQKKGGKDKKKKGGIQGKPTKSHSAVYTDEAPKCHVCQHLMLHQDYEVPLPPPPPDGEPLYECCRHRRVHSVGHIDFPHHLHSPPFVRAYSCSPTRSASSHLHGVPPPHNRLYSPILSQAPRIPVLTSQSSLPQGVDSLRERLSGKPQIFLHKTPSRTSLLSSESDHSMECTSHGHLKSDIVTMRCDDANYCSTNSTVSMSSENSPAQGRKKSEDPIRVRGQRFHRSASYSTGDDGISSENDDHEDAHLLGAVSRDVCRNGGKLSGRLRDMKNKVLKGREGQPPEALHSMTVQVVHRPPIRRENSSGMKLTSFGSPVCSSPQSPHASRCPEVPMYTSDPVMGKAVVHTDYDPQGKEGFLLLKRGDVIHIISMGHSGIWRGILNGYVGYFRFADVDVLGEDGARSQRRDKSARQRTQRRVKPKCVEELMQRIGLEHLTSVFMLNGFEMLETFSELDADDLNKLNITDPEQRAKLLTAAELLNDCDSNDASDSHTKSDPSGSGATSSDTPSSLSPATVTGGDNTPARAGNSSRDSGCYASNEQLMLKDAQRPHSTQKAKVVATSQNKGDKTASPQTECGHMCGMCGKPRRQGQSSREDEGMETDRSDKDYTEEDKEVCAITNGYLQDGKNSPNDKAKPSKKISGYCKHCIQSQSKAKASNNSPSRTTPKDSANSSLNSESSGNTTTSSVHSPINPNLQVSVYGSNSLQTKKVKPVPPPRAPGTEITSTKPEYARGMYPQVNRRPMDINSGSVYGRPQMVMPQMAMPQMVMPQMPLSMYYPERIASPHGSLIYGQGKQMAPEPIYGQITIKNVSRSLIPLVSTKLSAEKIDLSEEPYSSELGECGIPPLLIQRYAEELRQDIHSVALVLEQVRLYHLQNHQRNSVPNENLARSCSNAVDLKIASIEDFFISIGLPMYIDPLYEKGCCTIQILLNMSETDLCRITGADSRHLKRIIHAIDWVREKLQGTIKSPKSPTKSPTSSKSTSVRDKV